MKFSFENILNIFLIFIPLPIIGAYLHWPAYIIFFTACLGIVPLAGIMGKATEVLADRVGSGASPWLFGQTQVRGLTNRTAPRLRTSQRADRSVSTRCHYIVKP